MIILNGKSTKRYCNFQLQKVRLVQKYSRLRCWLSYLISCIGSFTQISGNIMNGYCSKLKYILTCRSSLVCSKKIGPFSWLVILLNFFNVPWFTFGSVGSPLGHFLVALETSKKRCRFQIFAFVHRQFQKSISGKNVVSSPTSKIKLILFCGYAIFLVWLQTFFRRQEWSRL